MNRRLIDVSKTEFPIQFHQLLTDAKVYDSSCSKQAKVYFIDKNKGFYLKKAPKFSLKEEAIMTDFFYKKGLSQEIIDYVSEDSDFLLSARLEGEDCLNLKYLKNPKKLCDVMAEELFKLHNTDYTNCPNKNKMKEYLTKAENNYYNKQYDISLFPDNWGYASVADAWGLFNSNKHLLENDTLVHGDYCLPNIILNNWKFSGFIDLGSAGIGDKHIDIFWGAWTLFYNLKTEKYKDRFFDAYGRNHINLEKLKIISAIEVFS